ncbi:MULTISPECIES: FAD-dependent oxidoreductase [unclassified Sphingomonas]|uniref:FAD-dependent oxidoreductase n=1 Tax=unclassified Sphingomonas TaxID=196159 RepID=UPI0006FBD427|nr:MULTISPECIES: FAD-dependent oxidoreductase [unclassified Sphingomonas]KQX19985.1 monooxygenase [Sphingomonas sp. Root1294]KQY67233.1 monooxygenase [Sphingomonas sp. Root50]KRB90607.1 monooxygenase [Sphingomonas sp. Root720]
MGNRLVIAGGGPAGMMAGLLFARAGVETLVIEKHGDFLRDFRGDTVHPSTIELFDELGLAEALLLREHDVVTDIFASVGGRSYRVADLTHLPVRHKFMMMMPQWHFLDFVRDAAARWPAFSLRMDSEVVDLVLDGGRIGGVVLKDGERIAADLVIGADGRGSVLRDAAGLARRDLGAPIDIFWFRVPKPRTRHNDTMGRFTPGTVIAMIDRGDYWQCAFVFAKGGADRIRAGGLDDFRKRVALAVPEIAASLDAIRSWDDVKLLSVSLDRLTRWHRPGFLAIGDAAHAMSPVGGVGINLAIQDAVAAANILAGPLARGEAVDRLLAQVQARRLFPVRVVQGMQRVVHARVLGPTLSANAQMKAPFALRMLDRFPILQRIPARIVGLGVRREHIRSPAAIRK